MSKLVPGHVTSSELPDCIAGLQRMFQDDALRNLIAFNWINMILVVDNTRNCRN